MRLIVPRHVSLAKKQNEERYAMCVVNIKGTSTEMWMHHDYDDYASTADAATSRK